MNAMKRTARKIDRGFYEYRGFFLLRFRTRQFSRNYRSAPKNALIQGKPEWHIFREYYPEWDEGKEGSSAGYREVRGVPDRNHSVFGLEAGEGLDTLQAAKEWVDDLIYERGRKPQE